MANQHLTTPLKLVNIDGSSATLQRMAADAVQDYRAKQASGEISTHEDDVLRRAALYDALDGLVTTYGGAHVMRWLKAEDLVSRMVEEFGRDRVMRMVRFAANLRGENL